MLSYLIFVIMPVVEFLLIFTVRYLLRVYDQGYKWFWPEWLPVERTRK